MQPTEVTLKNWKNASAEISQNGHTQTEAFSLAMPERHRITVVYTKEQKEKILQKAKAAGLSLSFFLKTLTLKEIDYKPPLASETRDVLLKLYREAMRQSLNLSQIARRVNRKTIESTKSIALIEILGRSILRTQKAIRTALIQGQPEL